MPPNRYSLSKLKLEDVKEAKRNLPLWDGTESKFQSWHHAFLHLAYCLNVSDFLSGSAIFPESFQLGDTSPSRPITPPLDVDSDSGTEEDPMCPVASTHTPSVAKHSVSPGTAFLRDDDISSIRSFTTQRGSVATFHNEAEYLTVAEHLSVLYSSFWTSIRESPSLVSLANTDMALDKRDVISAYGHIKSQYILSSGMGIMSVFSDFFELPRQSLTPDALLVKLDTYQKQLFDRGYNIDDVLLVAMLIQCLRNTQLRSTLNLKVTKYLAAKQAYPYAKAKALVRTFSNNFLQSSSSPHRKGTPSSSSTTKASPRSSTPHEGSTALSTQRKAGEGVSSVSSGTVSTRCYNCQGTHHWKNCVSMCSRCTASDHTPAKCPNGKWSTSRSAKTACHAVLLSDSSFIVDSGCSHTCVTDAAALSDYVQCSRPDQLYLANGTSIPIVGHGAIMGMSADHVPALTQPLLSVSSTCANGHICIFQHDCMHAIRRTSDVDIMLTQLLSLSARQDLVAYTAKQSGGLYRLVPPATACAGYYHATTRLGTLPELVRFFHECWGHPSVEQMCHIISTPVFSGIPPALTCTVVRKHFPQCAECTVGNLAQVPLSSHSESSIRIPGAVVEVDLKGPIHGHDGTVTPTFSGRKYVLQAVDLASDFGHCYLLRSRQNLHFTLRKLIMAYRADHHRIGTLRVDLELVTEPIRQLCGEFHITLQSSAPYEHGQIGHVERKHRTLSNMVVKAMSNRPHLVPAMWGMAYLDSQFKENLLPKPRLGHKSSYSIWYGHDFNLSTSPLLPFGSVVMAHVPVTQQVALGPRSFETYAVGVAPGVKGGVRLFNPATKRIIVRRSFKVLGPSPALQSHLQFLAEPLDSNISLVEDFSTSFPVEAAASPDIGLPIPATPNDQSAPECAISDEPTDSSDIPPVPLEPAPVSDPATNVTEVPSRRRVRFNNNPIGSTHIIPNRYGDIPSVAPPKRAKKKKSRGRPRKPTVSSPPTSTNPYEKYYPVVRHTYHVERYSLPIPKTVKQARTSPERSEWLAALQSELTSMRTSGTFLPLSVPVADIKQYESLNTKLIFDKRYNPDGTLKKYKARLVARGDLQHTYSDLQTYAGTATSKSIHLILAIAAELDLHLLAIDIASAFLYPDYVGPKLIVKRPPGLTDQEMPEYMELGKCIYGLKQAARMFRKHLDATLKSIGFVPTRADTCVYIYRRDNDFIIAMTHVDDIGFASTSMSFMNEVREQLGRVYDLSIITDMSHYLGMNISRDLHDKSIFLNQSGYIESLMEEFSVSVTKPPSIPISIPSDFDSLIATSPALSTIGITMYQARVGSLLYLATHTRPDILYATTFLARYTKSPTEYHLSLVNRLLEYVVSSKDLGLRFHSGEGIVLYASSDASYACHPDRKSHSGITLHIGRHSGSLYSMSKKQPVVALSSTEAEFVATTEAAKEIVWCRLLLYDLGFPQSAPTVLFQDNQSTIKLLTDESYHAKTKHIDVRFHFVRELITDGVITPVYLSTTEMPSDLLTKSLPRTSFLRIRPFVLGPTTVH